MQINKFVKKKNDMYNIVLEYGTVLVAHQNLILKYDLLIKKSITNELRNIIEEENLTYIAYNIALKYIANKMRTKKEIKEYLLKKEVDETIANNVIEMLENDSYIKDETYAVAFINDKINLSNDGPNKILRELVDKGIDQSIAFSKIEIFDKETQKEKIKMIADKLIKNNKTKSTYFLKNKIIEYLSNLGYDKSLILDAINNISFVENNNIAKKEYEKIYKRLSRKYSGKELELKIRQKMYSLGFKEYLGE